VFTWRIRCHGVAALSTLSRHCHRVSGQCRRYSQSVQRQCPCSMRCRQCHINRFHSSNPVHSQFSLRRRWFLHIEVPARYSTLHASLRRRDDHCHMEQREDDGSTGNTAARFLIATPPHPSHASQSDAPGKQERAHSTLKGKLLKRVNGVSSCHLPCRETISFFFSSIKPTYTGGRHLFGDVTQSHQPVTWKDVLHLQYRLIFFTLHITDCK
jgi:hypothetical protein